MVELDSPGRKKENVLVYAEGPVGNVAEPGRGTILATVVLQEVPELELMGAADRPPDVAYKIWLVGRHVDQPERPSQPDFLVVAATLLCVVLTNTCRSTEAS